MHLYGSSNGACFFLRDSFWLDLRHAAKARAKVKERRTFVVAKHEVDRFGVDSNSPLAASIAY